MLVYGRDDEPHASNSHARLSGLSHKAQCGRGHLKPCGPWRHAFLLTRPCTTSQVVECVPKPPAQAPSTSPGLAAALAAAAGGGGGPAQQLPPQQSPQRYAAKIIDRGSVKREGGSKGV